MLIRAARQAHLPAWELAAMPAMWTGLYLEAELSEIIADGRRRRTAERRARRRHRGA